MATKERITIDGMHCASCVAAVERSLKKVPGVEFASVNLATESAAVEFNAEATGTDALLKAIEDAGYRAALAPQRGATATPARSGDDGQVTMAIDGMHCASCVAAVEKSLKKVPGVEFASVNLATETAAVEYDSEATGTDAVLKAI